ncbi:MAG TPA: hypothetical protein VK014_08650 [Cyclobacteriaceae bacterium]|nr:hypothetical protein [Cyclobacteriaceae bacterium]
MFTTLILLVSMAFYVWYNTSQKAILSRNNALACWAQDNARVAKIVATFALTLSLGLSMTFYGFASGIFGFTVILMTIASCIVLLSPLQYIPTWVIAASLSLGLFLEFIWK